MAVTGLNQQTRIEHLQELESPCVRIILPKTLFQQIIEFVGRLFGLTFEEKTKIATDRVFTKDGLGSITEVKTGAVALKALVTCSMPNLLNEEFKKSFATSDNINSLQGHLTTLVDTFAPNMKECEIRTTYKFLIDLRKNLARQKSNLSKSDHDKKLEMIEKARAKLENNYSTTGIGLASGIPWPSDADLEKLERKSGNSTTTATTHHSHSSGHTRHSRYNGNYNGV